MEINCETESLARTQEFQLLAHDILLQIAASKPLYIKEDDVPEEHIKETKEIFYKQAEKEGKPEHIRQRITEGKLKSYLKEICLLSQPFIKDPSITIQDYINQFISKAKEKVVIKRFVRFELGKEERFG
jgi:elongation factor Ts